MFVDDLRFSRPDDLNFNRPDDLNFNRPDDLNFNCPDDTLQKITKDWTFTKDSSSNTLHDKRFKLILHSSQKIKVQIRLSWSYVPKLTSLSLFSHSWHIGSSSCISNAIFSLMIFPFLEQSALGKSIPRA